MPLFLSLYLKKSFYISFSLSVFIFFYMLQMEIYVLEKIIFNSSSKGQGHVCIYGCWGGESWNHTKNLSTNIHKNIVDS